MGTIMYINRVKHYFDEPSRVLIIHSLDMSILNHCNTVWGTTNNTLLFKLQKLQKSELLTARQENMTMPLPYLKDYNG